jgi:hypothetical protein
MGYYVDGTWNCGCGDTQFLRTPRYMDTNARGYIYIIRRTAGGIYI